MHTETVIHHYNSQILCVVPTRGVMCIQRQRKGERCRYCLKKYCIKVVPFKLQCWLKKKSYSICNNNLFKYKNIIQSVQCICVCVCVDCSVNLTLSLPCCLVYLVTVSLFPNTKLESHADQTTKRYTVYCIQYVLYTVCTYRVQHCKKKE